MRSHLYRVFSIRDKRTKLDRFAIDYEGKIGFLFNEAQPVAFHLIDRAMPFAHALAIQPKISALARANFKGEPFDSAGFARDTIDCNPLHFAK
jgi:hypothetical protein